MTSQNSVLTVHAASSLFFTRKIIRFDTNKFNVSYLQGFKNLAGKSIYNKPTLKIYLKPDTYKVF